MFYAASFWVWVKSCFVQLASVSVSSEGWKYFHYKSNLLNRKVIYPSDTIYKVLVILNKALYYRTCQKQYTYLSKAAGLWIFQNNVEFIFRILNICPVWKLSIFYCMCKGDQGLEIASNATFATNNFYTVAAGGGGGGGENQQNTTLKCQLYIWQKWKSVSLSDNHPSLILVILSHTTVVYLKNYVKSFFTVFPHEKTWPTLTSSALQNSLHRNHFISFCTNTIVEWYSSLYLKTHASHLCK